MTKWPDSNGAVFRRYVRGLGLRTAMAARVYHCILRGFQRFISGYDPARPVSQVSLTAWIQNRITVWPLHLVIHRARLVDQENARLIFKEDSPHTFRHTTAVHLIAAGVDVTVIRSWLGHAHLDTTNHYAQADLKTKRVALEQVASKSRPSKPPRWKRDQDLLAWLNSL